MAQGRVSLKDNREAELESKPEQTLAEKFDSAYVNIDKSETAPPLLRKSSKSVKRTKGDIIADVIASSFQISNNAVETTTVSQNKAAMFSVAAKTKPEQPTLRKRRSRMDYILGSK